MVGIRTDLFKFMIERIGNTGLYLVRSLSRFYGCSVYVKADYMNPGMSAKDRPAFYMVRDAERRGLLKPGYTVVEASSGNTAIGLAMICKELGYKCHFFLSKKCSDEKISLLGVYGATHTVCASSGCVNDPESTIGRAKRYCDTRNDTYFCNQYANEANSRSHYETTGPEIWDQTDGTVTHFFAGVGTGGTITGVGRFLKEQNPQVCIIGVDPVGSVLYDFFYNERMAGPADHVCQIEGIGRSFIPDILDISVIDKFVQVTDAATVRAAYGLVDVEGMLTGFSSAAVLAALDQIKDDLNSNDKVVLFFPDHGSRYLSKLYNPVWLGENIPDYGKPSLKFESAMVDS